jgi:hypothetical protein
MASEKDSKGIQESVAVFDSRDADLKLEEFGYQPELPRVRYA